MEKGTVRIYIWWVSQCLQVSIWVFLMLVANGISREDEQKLRKSKMRQLFGYRYYHFQNCCEF